jgi:hypothetical protein
MRLGAPTGPHAARGESLAFDCQKSSPIVLAKFSGRRSHRERPRHRAAQERYELPVS